MTRFAVIFLALLAGLFTLEMQSGIQQAVVEPFTAMLAKISAAIILPFDPTVQAHGKVLQFTDTGFAVSIEAGCNGVEAGIVLLAAIFAYPARWRVRIVALALGLLTVQMLNILRIISLFYLGNWNLDFFTWVHLYLWPTLIMLDVLITFVIYLRYLARSTGNRPHASA